MTESQRGLSDDSAELKAILGEFAALVKPFGELSKIKVNDPAALLQLDRAGASYPHQTSS